MWFHYYCEIKMKEDDQRSPPGASRVCVGRGRMCVNVCVRAACVCECMCCECMFCVRVCVLRMCASVWVCVCASAYELEDGRVRELGGGRKGGCDCPLSLDLVLWITVKCSLKCASSAVLCSALLCCVTWHYIMALSDLFSSLSSHPISSHPIPSHLSSLLSFSFISRWFFPSSHLSFLLFHFHFRLFSSLFQLFSFLYSFIMAVKSFENSPFKYLGESNGLSSSPPKDASNTFRSIFSSNLSLISSPRKYRRIGKQR
jgi:hypothetical protein